MNLCPNLSVAENIFAGRYPRMPWWRGAASTGRAMQREARRAAGAPEARLDVTRLLSSYPVAVQQMVAIARATGVSARVLILDEPTSSLDDGEVERLFGVLRRLRDEGMAILFVTHFLEQVYAVSDRITVLRNGELVGEYLTARARRAGVDRAHGGPRIDAAAPRSRPRAARERRDAGARGEDCGAKASCSRRTWLRRGEIVGLAGLLGSGRTELARLVFGLDAADDGEVASERRARQVRQPGAAIAPGWRSARGSQDRRHRRRALACAKTSCSRCRRARGWATASRDASR